MEEEAVRREVFSRTNDVRVVEEWFTPAGRQRSAPMYSATVSNGYLGKERTIKGADLSVIERKLKEQVRAWNEEEVRDRLREHADDADEDAQESIKEIQEILTATLEVDDRLNWKELTDRRKFRKFTFDVAPPVAAPTPPEPALPGKPILAWFVGSIELRWRERCEALRAAHASQVEAAQAEHAAAVAQWKQEREAAHRTYEAEKARFVAEKQRHNESIADFQRRFEAGQPEAVEEYLAAVFERSQYPATFSVTHTVAYDAVSKTAVVDVELPLQSSVPDVIGYKFIAAKKERKAVTMKPKEHDALYDDAIKQTVLRTLHETFESAYTPHVQRVVVNGWVTGTDPATGHSARTCVVSVSSAQAEFEAINLKNVRPTECLKKLKALTAGPLSQVAPVQPILTFNREDARFVEAKTVLDGLDSSINLAEIPWEDFEHLVRELFSRMFSGKGAEVKVTQASRDQGVDAIAFDPDPVRGGKFVIQAKRYTKVVSVAAVRELYGTMINEGATKGILVTTADFGPDSHEFAKNKPLTLINGANLVYLLEEYGHRVRVDVTEARAKRAAV